MPQRLLKVLADVVLPDPSIRYSDWADKYFYLSRESSAEYGRYRISRTPFVKEILDELSPISPTQVVVLVKPTQLAGTTIGLIFLCAMMDVSPGPALFIGVTDAKTRSFSKKKLSKAIESSPRLKGKIKEPKSRDSGNTILMKEFDGGSLMLTGSNSGASYRSESIKYLVLDDFDGFEPDIEGEGSPEELADRRTGSFPNRKIYINSTTTLKDLSNIENAFEHSSQGYFNVPCPHCGFLQYLEWGGLDIDFGIKFERDENKQIIDIWYQCKGCGGRIDERFKTQMIAHGKYIHKFPERKTKGFRYNALVTPLGWINDWKYIAEKFLEAKFLLDRGVNTKMKTWQNSFMSTPYEEKGDRPAVEALSKRCELYDLLSVPRGGLILTCGVDVQDNRLVAVIRAWGRDFENWLIYFGEIFGDPSIGDVKGSVWTELDSLAGRSFKHASGVDLSIIAVAVDSGFCTQAVYNYCRKRAPKFIAVKGQSQTGRPIIGRPTKQDVTWDGKVLLDSVQVWPVGGDTAKEDIYSKLNLETDGPGKYHFPVGTTTDYFKQLTAEKKVKKIATVGKNRGRMVLEWVKTGPRNDFLDAEIYARAAFEYAGGQRIDFDKIEKSLGRKKGGSAPDNQEINIESKGDNWATRGRSWSKR